MRLSDENTREGRHLTPEERIALQAEEIKQLQQENNGWRERYDELDAGHSRLFKDFCKLQQENEQLRAQVAAMKTAICNMCRGKECDNCAFGDANITETIKHWRPERVCLCGSTRFFRAFDDWNFRFTLEGKIVLTIGCNTKSDKGLGLTDEDKIKLDELHKRKIDLADWIFVIDVGGYIGSSTQSEIEYAQLHGKPIKYLSKEFPDYQEPADYHNPADAEALRKAREALVECIDALELCTHNELCKIAVSPYDMIRDAKEALAEIDKAIGGKEDV